MPPRVSHIRVVAIAAAPAQAAQYLKFWRGLPDLGDLVINLTVLPLQFTYGSFRFIPPFWSVAIELDMYLLLFLIVSGQMAWALAAGLSFQLGCIFDAMSGSLDYFTAPSAVYPFAAGAVLISCAAARCGQRRPAPPAVRLPHGLSWPGHPARRRCFTLLPGHDGERNDRFAPSGRTR